MTSSTHFDRQSCLGSRLLAVFATFVAIALAGCATSDGTQAVAPLKVAPPLGGHVMGGQQPISGSSIQMFAYNPDGTATSLLNTPVTSDGNGNFTITNDYTCAPGALVYLIARQGNAGAGNNYAITLETALGPCSALTPSSFFTMNEVTTVAFAYSFHAFIPSDGSMVIASSPYVANSFLGVTNGFGMFTSLVNPTSGQSPGPTAPANAVVPTAEINTLADILSVCINGTQTGTGCPALFNLILNQYGSKPTETFGAIMSIALHPNVNVTQLFNLVSGITPFQPTLTVAPHDWTLPVQLTQSGLSAPYGLAVNSVGNVWVTNESGFTITEFSPQGAALSGASGFGSTQGHFDFIGAQGLSIDASDNVWVANTGGHSVRLRWMQIDRKHATLAAGRRYSLGAAVAPVDVAVDQRGNVWVADFLWRPGRHLTHQALLHKWRHYANYSHADGEFSLYARY